MSNLSKIKRDNMIAFLEELKKTHSDDASIRAFNEIENHLREKSMAWCGRSIPRKWMNCL